MNFRKYIIYVNDYRLVREIDAASTYGTVYLVQKNNKEQFLAAKQIRHHQDDGDDDD